MESKNWSNFEREKKNCDYDDEEKITASSWVVKRTVKGSKLAKEPIITMLKNQVLTVAHQIGRLFFSSSQSS